MVMKKSALVVSILFIFSLLATSCGSQKGETAITMKSDPNVYPLFSAMYKGDIVMAGPDSPDGNTIIYVWNGMAMDTLTNADSYLGTPSWKITVNPGVDWFGWGIHVYPTTQVKDMSGFENGHLKFAARTKGGSHFKVGIKHGYSVESWLDILPGKWGFVDDGQWHVVSIPFADFVPKIKFKIVNIYWMMAQASDAQPPKGGSSYELSEIYWTKD